MSIRARLLILVLLATLVPGLLIGLRFLWLALAGYVSVWVALHNPDRFLGW